MTSKDCNMSAESQQFINLYYPQKSTNNKIGTV